MFNPQNLFVNIISPFSRWENPTSKDIKSIELASGQGDLNLPTSEFKAIDLNDNTRAFKRNIEVKEEKQEKPWFQKTKTLNVKHINI